MRSSRTASRRSSAAGVASGSIARRVATATAVGGDGDEVDASVAGTSRT